MPDKRDIQVQREADELNSDYIAACWPESAGTATRLTRAEAAEKRVGELETMLDKGCCVLAMRVGCAFPEVLCPVVRPLISDCKKCWLKRLEQQAKEAAKDA